MVGFGGINRRGTHAGSLLRKVPVRNPPPGSGPAAQRISLAFFHHPNYDALVECIAPEGQAKYPPVLSGEYRDQQYRRTRV